MRTKVLTIKLMKLFNIKSCVILSRTNLPILNVTILHLIEKRHFEGVFVIRIERNSFASIVRYRYI